VNPQYEAHERLCKSIGDMVKENEALKQRIKRLEAVVRLSTVQTDYIQQLETENDALRADLLLWEEKGLRP